jgi:hypothetical protein
MRRCVATIAAVWSISSLMMLSACARDTNGEGGDAGDSNIRVRDRDEPFEGESPDADAPTPPRDTSVRFRDTDPEPTPDDTSMRRSDTRGAADTLPSSRDTLEPDDADPTNPRRDTRRTDAGFRDTHPNDTGPSDTRSPDTHSSNDSDIRDLRRRARNLQPGGSLSGTVDVDEVVVTAVETRRNGDVVGAYVQEPNGPKAYSGLWIFFGNAQSSVSVPSLKRGDVLDVEGTVTNYDNQGSSQNGGLLEIEQISSLNVVRSNGSIPSPVRIQNPSEIATGGSRAEALEGVMVRVEDVTISQVSNQNGQPQYGEVTLQSGAIVDEKFYAYFEDYQFQQGTTYQYVQGPLHFSFDSTKITPRDRGDIDGPRR